MRLPRAMFVKKSDIRNSATSSPLTFHLYQEGRQEELPAIARHVEAAGIPCTAA